MEVNAGHNPNQISNTNIAVPVGHEMYHAVGGSQAGLLKVRQFFFLPQSCFDQSWKIDYYFAHIPLAEISLQSYDLFPNQTAIGCVNL